MLSRSIQEEVILIMSVKIKPGTKSTSSCQAVAVKTDCKYRYISFMVQNKHQSLSSPIIEMSSCSFLPENILTSSNILLRESFMLRNLNSVAQA